MDLPEDLVKEIHADRLRCRARLLEDQNPTFAAARRYLQRGWRPVPVHPHEKRPLIAWAAYQDRAPTLAEIMAWWQEHREARVGLVTGRGSGLVVVDIDVQHGGTLEGVDVPEGAYRVRTPSGGLHLYMAHPGGQVASRAGVRPGVDVRGDGGFVVAPPSPSGAFVFFGEARNDGERTGTAAPPDRPVLRPAAG